jgi:hypothetical protein
MAVILDLHMEWEDIDSADFWNSTTTISHIIQVRMFVLEYKTSQLKGRSDKHSSILIGMFCIKKKFSLMTT